MNKISKNTNEEATSGSNNRREGSGNSNNVNTKSGFFGGNKKRNANSNNTRSPNFKPQTQRVVNNKNIVRNNNNNNTRSFVTASSNNSNNNNNDIQSVKRIKVNNKRNRLIQNLKKKSLPNFVINGLVKRYDNKQNTVNQILIEANNFGKTFTMGKTAQRIGTLRKRVRT